jgi:putative tricarboxylic transport membrane protein
MTGQVSQRIVEVGREGRMQSLSRDDIRRILPHIIRGTPLGIFIGAVPGLGSAVAAYLSYGLAKRFARDRAQFGKGSLEGVAAAECANNAVCSSTMIPVLALGVPGDVVTAIMLGALTIHGIIPGPALFQQQGDLITGLFVLMAVTSVLHLVIGRIGLFAFIRALDVPRSIMFPVVFVVCVVGTFVATSSYFAVYTMLAVGVVGFLMLKTGIPIAPLLIGFILGPLIEVKLRQALFVSRGDFSIFLTRPISAVLLGMTLIVIAAITWQTWRESRVATPAPTRDGSS